MDGQTNTQTGNTSLLCRGRSNEFKKLNWYPAKRLCHCPVLRFQRFSFRRSSTIEAFAVIASVVLLAAWLNSLLSSLIHQSSFNN